MKVTSLVAALALTYLLAGCEPRNQFQEAVLNKMQQDSDIKDYRLDSEEMTDCIMTKLPRKMPGVFALDPRRLEAYQHYQKMLALPDAQNPQQTLQNLREVFGSPSALADAHRNYSQSFMDCLTELIAKRDENLTERPRPDAGSTPAVSAPATPATEHQSAPTQP
ncbi:MAG: hypothetical protein RQ715_02935 [Methylococcales bacterium]|nr:hypothetical protein [Methylococcales bacterium]